MQSLQSSRQLSKESLSSRSLFSFPHASLRVEICLAARTFKRSWQHRIVTLSETERMNRTARTTRRDGKNGAHRRRGMNAKKGLRVFRPGTALFRAEDSRRARQDSITPSSRVDFIGLIAVALGAIDSVPNDGSRLCELRLVLAGAASRTCFAGHSHGGYATRPLSCSTLV